MQKRCFDGVGFAKEIITQGHGIIQRVDAGLGLGIDVRIGDAIFVQQDGQGHGSLVTVVGRGYRVTGLQHAIPAAQQWLQDAVDIHAATRLAHDTGQQPCQVFIQRLHQDIGSEFFQGL